MVGVRGLEPRTSSLSVKCSNQLSYTPKNFYQLPNFTKSTAFSKGYQFKPFLRLATRKNFDIQADFLYTQGVKSRISEIKITNTN